MHSLPEPTDDGLYIPEVGDWSADKHHFLWRYLNAFTTAMKDKRWSGLHYIDLFAGAGIERLKESKRLDWGSPLLAGQARSPFSRLHLCELNQRKHAALEKRIGRFPQPEDPQVVRGDANKAVHELIQTIPGDALSLAFLDPYGLHLDLTTVQTLAHRRADLIIFFPDRLDVLRNRKIYEATPNSKLDRFMGEGVDWRSAMRNAPQSRWAEILQNLYEEQLRSLRYKYVFKERISAKRHPLYLLLFCSEHEAGATIWRRVSRIKPDGQRSFDFGE